MDNLKKFLEENRDDFDHLSPDEGHFNRFRGKLKGESIRPWYLNYWVAAVLVIGILFSSLAYIMVFEKQGNNLYAGFDKEMEETIYYYSSINSEMQNEISQMNFATKTEKVTVLKDIEQYDRNFNSLLADFKMFPGDERVKNAIIEHLQEKAELLKYIILQVNITTE